MNEQDRSNSLELERVKKPYVAPQLICYGDIRDVTLAGSPGSGDSTVPGTLGGGGFSGLRGRQNR